MFTRYLSALADAAGEYAELPIFVYSIDTGELIAVTYDVAPEVNEYDEPALSIQI